MRHVRGAIGSQANGRGSTLVTRSNAGRWVQIDAPLVTAEARRVGPATRSSNRGPVPVRYGGIAD